MQASHRPYRCPGCQLMAPVVPSAVAVIVATPSRTLIASGVRTPFLSRPDLGAVGVPVGGQAVGEVDARVGCPPEPLSRGRRAVRVAGDRGGGGGLRGGRRGVGRARRDHGAAPTSAATRRAVRPSAPRHLLALACGPCHSTGRGGGATPTTRSSILKDSPCDRLLPSRPALDLAPHPEGGWYRRTWTSSVTVDTPTVSARARRRSSTCLDGTSAATISSRTTVVPTRHPRVVLSTGGDGDVPADAVDHGLDPAHPQVLVAGRHVPVRLFGRSPRC